jgi:hypothetical protein
MYRRPHIRLTDQDRKAHARWSRWVVGIYTTAIVGLLGIAAAMPSKTDTAGRQPPLVSTAAQADPQAHP